MMKEKKEKVSELEPIVKEEPKPQDFPSVMKLDTN
jgi:hypothetical protein